MRDHVKSMCVAFGDFKKSFVPNAIKSTGGITVPITQVQVGGA